MRIIYLHQYFTTPSMSGGVRSYEMASHLVSSGHEVNVVTTWREPLTSRSTGWYETNENGIRVHWLPVEYSNTMTFARRMIAFGNFVRAAQRKAVTIGGDIVFATSTPLTIALPAVRAARALKVPMVFEVRDLWPSVPIGMGVLRNPILTRAARWLERYAYANSAGVVALSPGMKRGVVATGYPSELVTVIPNLCVNDFFQVSADARTRFRRKHPWLQHRPLVVYTGALGAVNGVGYLVRLAARVLALDPEIRFLIVGSGKEYGFVEKTAEDLGVLNKNFFMMRSIPRLEIRDVLLGADLATSVVINNKVLFDNSANKFFDALAAGKPVAINHAGWQAELIQATDAGLVLPPDDFESAASIVTAALHNRAWLKRAGQAARRLALEEFSRVKLTAKFENVLVDAARCNQRRSSGVVHSAP